VARQLLEAHGDIRVVVNAAAPGRQSKGFAEAESRRVGELHLGNLKAVFPVYGISMNGI
jgi:hypothetical protein